MSELGELMYPKRRPHWEIGRVVWVTPGKPYEISDVRLGKDIVEGDTFDDRFRSTTITKIDESINGYRSAYAEDSADRPFYYLSDKRVFAWCDKHRHFGIDRPCIECYPDPPPIPEGEFPKKTEGYECAHCEEPRKTEEEAIECCGGPARGNAWLCGNECDGGGIHWWRVEAVDCIRRSMTKVTE